ncbi:MAG: transporter substrate-binding and LysM peptidoglycan-binding domain-containing protein [Ardenticatenaceae bacterium]
MWKWGVLIPFMLPVIACYSIIFNNIDFRIVTSNDPCTIPYGRNISLGIEGQGIPSDSEVGWSASNDGKLKISEDTFNAVYTPSESSTNVIITANLKVDDTSHFESVSCKIEGKPQIAEATSTPDIDPTSPPVATLVPPTAPTLEIVPETTPFVSIPVESVEPRVERIFENGYFIAAVRKNLRPFSYIDGNGHWSGFEIDILREFARRWFENDTHIIENLLPIEDSDERMLVITQGPADMVISALTRNDERDQKIDFSEIYFEDGQHLLVNSQADPPIKNVCDLNQKFVGVFDGTTGINNIKNVTQNQCGFRIDDYLKYYPNHADAVAALQNQAISAVTTDGIILSQYENNSLKLAGLSFSEELYGIGLPEGDQDLKTLIDLTLQAMKADGTYDAIFCHWFPERVLYPMSAPNSMEELLKDLKPEMRDRFTTELPPLYDKETECASRPEPNETADIHTYTVQEGDTLSGIALCHYGAASLWPEIFKENREYIENNGGHSGYISPSWVLTIPPVSEITYCDRSSR